MTVDALLRAIGIALGGASLVFVAVLLAFSVMRVLRLKARLKRLQQHPTLSVLRAAPVAGRPLQAALERAPGSVKGALMAIRRLAAIVTVFGGLRQDVGFLGDSMDDLLSALIPSLRGMVSR